MCGICGVWGESNRTAVEAMVKAMRHRGPDDQGLYHDAKVTLGMTRLAVIDASSAGHQPMSAADGAIWIVYNGEVSNFVVERRILESLGHTFQSNSDTEVVLHMYTQYGDDFLIRLRGMFALAIYDKRRGPGHERLMLARDQIGIKPLLYSRIGPKLIFASEMKALLASRIVAPEIDPEALRLLLTFGSVYQPRTMLRGVQMLLPGHFLILETGRAERMERYWNLNTNRHQELRSQPYTCQVEALTAALKDTLRLHMISDVPLGAFLSGGVDSSVLVALMAQIAGARIKTFSVGFESGASAIDESSQAKETANFLGTDHTHVLVRGSDVLERIRHIAGSLDQPSVDGVNSYFVSLAASQAVTVAVSGTGGDEIFAGYPSFITMALYQQLAMQEPLPARVRSMLGALAQHSLFDSWMAHADIGRVCSRLRAGRDFVSRYAGIHTIFGSYRTSHLLAGDLRSEARSGRAERYDLSAMDELPHGTSIERVTALCLRGYTANQLLRDIDTVSMAHSLEVRVPYLDTMLVDLALSMPDEAKLSLPDQCQSPHDLTYRASGAKRVLIDAGRPLLPKDFDLQPKRGFTMPFDTWLHGPLCEVLMDSLSESRVRQRGWLSIPEAESVKKDFLQGRISWAQPWLLMMLELWAQEVIDTTPRIHKPLY